ncbi:MAG TPA: adenylate/guanylate cyclase domain-containing protein [Terriglobales bacterium]|nr:adenylate/guanylate cyclase domain-containing protein [Terriglobales bacterium]
MAGLQRSRRQFVRGALLAATASAAFVLLLAPTGALRWLETGTYDARARYAARSSPPDPRIVIVDIDNVSFENLKNSLSRWPWSRAVWTQLIWYLHRGSPRTIAFDSIFEGKESDAVDSDFAAQVHAAGNVVLAYAFVPTGENTDDPEVARAWQSLDREASAAGARSIGELTPKSEYTVTMPLEQLTQAAAGLGSITALPDSDGATRRMPLAHLFGSHSVPSFPVRVVDAAAGRAKSSGFTREGRSAIADSIRVPIDDEGRLLLAWRRGGSQAYQRVSFWEVICSMYPQNCLPQDRGKYPSAFFRDKIVIIGASATGAYEVRPTPMDAHAPGFIAHATAIDNLLHGDGIRIAPAWVLPLAVVLLAAIGAGILVYISGTVPGAAFALAVAGLYTGAAFAVFSRWHVWLPMAAPLVAYGLAYASSGAVRYATTGRELRRTRGTLDRYIAPQLVEYVLDHLDDIEFGGEKRDLTILFSDVRNFTTLTEASDPLQLISQLNDYLNAMTDVIFKYHGVVDKFIGDGILAHWGAFNPGQNHAELAARAALEMFERLAELNIRWKEQGLPQLDIGVGINTGEVVFGNVGAGKKIEFTVIGDPVNLAARLESLNKEFKAHIIISEFTLARLGDIAQVRSLGGVKVKGKTIETAIYELNGLGQAGASPAAKPAPDAAQTVSARADD